MVNMRAEQTRLYLQFYHRRSVRVCCLFINFNKLKKKRIVIRYMRSRQQNIVYIFVTIFINELQLYLHVYNE